MSDQRSARAQLFDRLLTMEEARALRARDLSKGASRLDKKVVRTATRRDNEAAFHVGIWKRDERKCRKCGVVCRQGGEVDPKRGEVHHIHGRLGPLRFEARAALLLCLTCHERVTGAVGRARWHIVATKTFTLIAKGVERTYTDARATVRFITGKKAA